MAQYSINFINNSSNSGNFMCFQKDPDISTDGVMSLAWFAKYAHPNTNIRFDWEIDYSFVWGQTGELIPGVMFYAGETLDADLEQNNKVTLRYLDGAYTFTNQTTQEPGGSLYVYEDDTVPLKMASVGIGMSGAGTFVVQAQPNMNVTFTPHPTYWVAFGNYQTGEVLDIQEINNDAQVEFPPGVYAMNAILNMDNTWTIEPVASTNARYAEAVQQNKEAVYGA